MERTITRIKNLKSRRKLSLPASPCNSNSNNIGGGGGSIRGKNVVRSESVCSYREPLPEEDSMRRNSSSHRTASDCHRWSPDLKERLLSMQRQQRHNSSSNITMPVVRSYRRSESVCAIEEDKYIVGATAAAPALKRRHTRHGSLPHVFRNLCVHNSNSNEVGRLQQPHGGGVGVGGGGGGNVAIKPPAHSTPSSSRRGILPSTPSSSGFSSREVYARASASSAAAAGQRNLLLLLEEQQEQQRQLLHNHVSGLLRQSTIAVSLPSKIDQISDEEENDKSNCNGSVRGSNGSSQIRRGNKLKRRKAYYTRQRSDITQCLLGPTWSLPLDALLHNNNNNNPSFSSSSAAASTDCYCGSGLSKGRSKSLTSIDALNPLSAMDIDLEASEAGGGGGGGGGDAQVQQGHQRQHGGHHHHGGRLLAPPTRCESAGGGTSCSTGYQRRRKLSTAGKVSSGEFLTVSFECFEGEKGPEEFMPATRGTCLREAISTVCERRGVDVDSINVYLDSSVTPLPLLTTETSWLGGRLIRIRAKDDNKSPVRVSERLSVTAPPSRKASAVSNSGRSNKSRLFNPSSSSDDASALLSTSAGSGSTGLGLGHSNPQQSLSALNISQAASFDNSCLLRVSVSQGLNATASGGGKAAKAANRWSGLWGSSAKESKMAALVQQLDTYSKIGIPKLHHNANFEYEDEVEEALYSLEEDWTDLVRKPLLLSERARSQQTAIWELVETEVAYIRTLKVIQDLFLNCLCNLQSNSILTEIDTEKLFCNIPEIFAANRVFWQENVNPMVRRARDTGDPLDPDLLLEGFLKFEEIFSPYSRYCSEQTNCQEYCREQDRNNDIFKAYLAWCETQKDCNRLRLLDILVRPMQRLTKYSLLLKAILKKTDDEQQRNNLVLMDGKVDAFVSDVNSHLRQRQENERLKTIIARIESYEPVETKDDDLERLVAGHCRLDLTAPMPGCAANHRRHLLFEGDLKLKEGYTSKTDVHAFLFSDMLLLCKALNKKQGGLEGKVKVIRQPFVIDRLVVTDISKDHNGADGGGGGGQLAAVYLNEYSVVSSAFTLHSSDSRAIKAWKEQIQKAKDLYEEAKTATTRALLEHRNSSFYFSSYGEDEEVLPSGNAAAKGPRRGSFRGSRLSSIGHSYSGSVDMNELLGGNSSPQLFVISQQQQESGVRRNKSFELQSQCSSSLGVQPPNNSMAATPTHNSSQLQQSSGSLQQSPLEQQLLLQQQQQRASSVSSEEGSVSSSSMMGKQLGSYPPSPRAERKQPPQPLTSKLSPNTLTVQVPFQQQQSLPNLSSDGGNRATTAASPPNSPGSSRRSKSPTARGISYPPVSPKSLKRGVAIHPSMSIKNPPLLKSRHVVSEGGYSQQQLQQQQSVAIPVITGVEDDDDEAPVAATEDSDSDLDLSESVDVLLPFPPPPPPLLPQQQQQQQVSSGSNNDPAMKQQQQQRGSSRSTDTRRYHTAGAIEDIKKETVRDHSIQKRLSWNYGQQTPPNANNELKNSNKCLSSSDSMRSSSGVSSTGSLHLSIGEVDSAAAANAEHNGKDKLHKPFGLNRPPGGKAPPPPVPPRNIPMGNSIHVSSTYITQDEVVVTSSPKLTARVNLLQPQISVTGSNQQQQPKGDIIKLREMLLSDHSVESSNV